MLSLKVSLHSFFYLLTLVLSFLSSLRHTFLNYFSLKIGFSFYFHALFLHFFLHDILLYLIYLTPPFPCPFILLFCPFHCLRGTCALFIIFDIFNYFHSELVFKRMTTQIINKFTVCENYQVHLSFSPSSSPSSFSLLPFSPSSFSKELAFLYKVIRSFFFFLSCPYFLFILYYFILFS